MGRRILHQIYKYYLTEATTTIKKKEKTQIIAEKIEIKISFSVKIATGSKLYCCLWENPLVKANSFSSLNIYTRIEWKRTRLFIFIMWAC